MQTTLQKRKRQATLNRPPKTYLQDTTVLTLRQASELYLIFKGEKNRCQSNVKFPLGIENRIYFPVHDRPFHEWVRVNQITLYEGELR